MDEGTSGEQPFLGDRVGGDKLGGDKVAGDKVTNIYNTPQLAADPLSAALKLLASMPLDTIPAVAPLPPGSRMPFAHNPLFVGREADLLALF